MGAVQESPMGRVQESQMGAVQESQMWFEGSEQFVRMQLDATDLVVDVHASWHHL